MTDRDAASPPARPAAEDPAAPSPTERARRWRAENAVAIEDHDRLVEREGVLLAGFRKF
jgi:post-segregation antitoxin (ccd killing protein)